jgi:hypothetical protein
VFHQSVGWVSTKRSPERVDHWDFGRGLRSTLPVVVSTTVVADTTRRAAMRTRVFQNGGIGATRPKVYVVRQRHYFHPPVTTTSTSSTIEGVDFRERNGRVHHSMGRPSMPLVLLAHSHHLKGGGGLLELHGLRSVLDRARGHHPATVR